MVVGILKFKKNTVMGLPDVTFVNACLKRLEGRIGGWVGRKRQQERGQRKERERERFFHELVHFPNAYITGRARSGRARSGRSWKPGPQLGSPTWVARTQVL